MCTQLPATLASEPTPELQGPPEPLPLHCGDVWLRTPRQGPTDDEQVIASICKENRDFILHT